MIYESKQCKGLQYITHKVNGGSVVEVRYKGKQLMTSPRKVEIKPVLTMLETAVPQYSEVMENALLGYEYDRERSNELRTRLYEIFSKYAKGA